MEVYFMLQVLHKYFSIFIFLISAVILQLTGFYPRKVLNTRIFFNKLLFIILFTIKQKYINKMGEQFKIIEYPLIIIIYYNRCYIFNIN